MQGNAEALAMVPGVLLKTLSADKVQVCTKRDGIIILRVPLFYDRPPLATSRPSPLSPQAESSSLPLFITGRFLFLPLLTLLPF